VERVFGWGDFVYLLYGAGWTVTLSIFALVGGSLVGAFIAAARISHFKTIRLFAMSYIYLVQSTPLLMQLFIAYFGFTLLGINLPALVAAAVVLTIYSGAFLGEIWRGCLEAVPSTQWMGARSLGLSRREQLIYVIVPQAARIAIPPTVGFVVQIIKNTSVTALIGFIELARAGHIIHGATFQPVQVFGCVAILYFVMCYPISVLSRRLEGRLNVGRAIVTST
jgi:polar amino acid transport system permease protein